MLAGVGTAVSLSRNDQRLLSGGQTTQAKPFGTPNSTHCRTESVRRRAMATMVILVVAIVTAHTSWALTVGWAQGSVSS